MNRRLLALTASLALLPAAAHADTLSAIKARGALVWGADQEGGGPYVYPSDSAPGTVVGFEVDLASALARCLGVEARLSQGQWDKLLDLLAAEKVDVVLNGYEFQPDKLPRFRATLPYYAYDLQLVTRPTQGAPPAVEALLQPGKKLGVLTGSAAERRARELCRERCEVVGYDGSTDALRDVETGRLDASVQDDPVMSFYGPRFRGLEIAPRPLGAGHYVVYARGDDRSLVDALDQALVDLHQQGELQRILTRHGLSAERQRSLAPIIEAARFHGLTVPPASSSAPSLDASAAPVAPPKLVGLDVARVWLPTLLQAAGVTIVLSLLSFPLAVAAGLFVALGRLYGPPWLRWPLTAYVELLRGTPLLLQLYFLFFLLPEVGIKLPAFTTAVLGLAINYSAYEAEIYRAGLQAVPSGQLEAALALGMTRTQALRRIIVPQALRIVIPPVVNDFIALFKDTSVCSVVTVIELTKRFSVLAMSTQAIVEMMAMTSLLYLAMSYPLARLSREVELRLSRGGER